MSFVMLPSVILRDVRYNKIGQRRAQCGARRGARACEMAAGACSGSSSARSGAHGARAARARGVLHARVRGGA